LKYLIQENLGYVHINHLSNMRQNSNTNCTPRVQQYSLHWL